MGKSVGERREEESRRERGTSSSVPHIKLATGLGYDDVRLELKKDQLGKDCRSCMELSSSP